MCRSRRELSNAYLLAKFGFDTAENEPCKVCTIERGGSGGDPCGTPGGAGMPGGTVPLGKPTNAADAPNAFWVAFERGILYDEYCLLN